MNLIQPLSKQFQSRGFESVLLGAFQMERVYIPLEVIGDQKEHIIAYLRTYRSQTCLVAALRFLTSLKSLEGTEILLPEGETIKADQLFVKEPYAWIFWASKSQKPSRPC